MLNNRRELQADVLDEPVRSLLAAAAAPTEPGPLPGEAEALAAFRASQTTTRRSPVLTYLTAFKTPIAAALGTGVLLTTGMGVAMAGSLPGAAQDTASELLGKVGVTVPGADEHSAGHADQRGGSEDAADEPASPEKDGKGSEVSELATTTDKKGVEKGAAISDEASDGKSQAGEEHGKAAEEHGKARRSTARPARTARARSRAPQRGTTQRALSRPSPRRRPRRLTSRHPPTKRRPPRTARGRVTALRPRAPTRPATPARVAAPRGRQAVREPPDSRMNNVCPRPGFGGTRVSGVLRRRLLRAGRAG